MNFESRNEAAPSYPEAFSALLKSNWDKTCRLMDWMEPNGQAKDWSFFENAQNPAQLVKDIQQKILEKEGKLPRFGVDGKFGPETQKALQELNLEEEKKENEAKAPATVARAPERRELFSEMSQEEKRALRRQKLVEIISVMPRAQNRLKAANLNIDRPAELLKNVDTYLVQYQTRAMAFREDLVQEEPLLKPLDPLVSALVTDFDVALKGIDLATVHTPEDFFAVMEELFTLMRTSLDVNAKELGLEETAISKVFLDGNMEVLMAYFSVVINELSLMILDCFKNDEANFKRIEDMLKDAFPLPEAREPASVVGPEVAVRVRDVSQLDRVEFQHEGSLVSFDVQSQILSFQSKKAKLSLPDGVALEAVEPLPGGGLSLEVKMGATSFAQRIEAAQLGDYLGKIAQANSGARIELGYGAAFELI